MNPIPRSVLHVWLLILASTAAARARECPPLPPDARPELSDRALELHCDFAGDPCTIDPADPGKAVRECGGLACVADASSSQPEAGVCRLPRTDAECAGQGELERGGGYCSAMGRSCTLGERDAGVANGNPDELPPETTPASSYQPSQDTIFGVCGGLGCIDDPASTDPTAGVCALAQTPEQCGGAANPGTYGGWCGPRHLKVNEPQPTRPVRWLATGGYVVDLGNDTTGGDVVPGGIFQIGLTQSQVRVLPDGSRQHFGLPSLYAHGAVLVSRRRVAPELGIVYKTGAELLTRVGIAAYAQLWAPEDVLSSASFGMGPSAHIELFYNVLLRGTYLFGEQASPEATLGVQYAASLFDDFK